MSDAVYIGRVMWVKEVYEKNYRHAMVEPLVQSSPDRKSWIGAIKDPVDVFPPRGNVYWHGAPENLIEGEFYEFEAEPHPYYSGQPDKEAFQVRSHKKPTEIIDLREIGSERDIRILLTTKGVFLNDGPLAESCVLWIQDDKWIGPVKLALIPGTKSWQLDPQALVGIRCWKIPNGAIHKVELEGTRYLLSPTQENLGQYTGLVTWESDKVLAKRVLNRLLKRDRKVASALGLSKEVFKKSIETLEDAGLVGAELEQELAFRERIQEILEAIKKNEDLLDEAASVCFELDPVKQAVEEKAKREYEKRLSEYEVELESYFAAKKIEIHDVEKDLKIKKTELDNINERINTTEQELCNRVNEFDAVLSQRLSKIIEKPEQLFAEMALFKGIAATVHPPCPPQGQGSHRLKAEHLHESQIIKDRSLLVGALSQRLLDIGISPQVGLRLHSSLLSGTVPVMIGSEALDVVRIYADCTSGGVLHWIPIGGTLFEPTDLLGRADPSSHSFLPHPGGLLDLLLDDSDAVHIVVLDGFNRASVDGYLLPILQLVRDATEGRGDLTIPLFSAGTTNNKNYGTTHCIAWSKNVLLVLRPTAGVSVLPVPRELWSHCAVIDNEETEIVPSSHDMKKSRVLKEDWISWSDEVLSLSNAMETPIANGQACAQLQHSIRRKIGRLIGSGVALGLDKDRAANEAMRLGLVPYLFAYDDYTNELPKILGRELDDQDQRIKYIINQLGE